MFWLHQNTDKEKKSSYWFKIIFRRHEYREDMTDFARLSSSGIRQKGESQNGCFKKTKHAKMSEKQTFLTP